MSRYDLFRRRLAPIAFLVAIVLLARETCTRQERTRATIVFELGDAAPRVRGVEAELVVDDEPVARLHKVALPDAPIGPVRMEAAMPAKDGDLRIVIDLGTSSRRMTRAIHTEDGGIVTIPLADALR